MFSLKTSKGGPLSALRAALWSHSLWLVSKVSSLNLTIHVISVALALSLDKGLLSDNPMNKLDSHRVTRQFEKPLSNNPASQFC